MHDIAGAARQIAANHSQLRTIYYLRHGETDWNVEGRLQGRKDIPLNARGRAQAVHCGEILRNLLARDQIGAATLDFISSPLGRARETMELARRELGLPTNGYRIDEQLTGIVPSWSMAPVVKAYQAMRGASFLVAVIFAAEIGDIRRFDTPRQLMAFLGLVPGERSTGNTVRRTSLTLAGNRRARRVLIEAAWTYRFPARVSEALRTRLEGLPKAVRDIAWKAQIRLCARYRRLSAAGKKRPVVIAAIAREIAAFLWAIGREVAPA